MSDRNGGRRSVRKRHPLTKAIVAILAILPLIAGCSSVPRTFVTEYAFIDFTTKPDGDPPAVLDSGQPVDYILESMEGRGPQIVDGRLVHGTLIPPGDSRNFANYYQAQLQGDCRAFGTRFTVDASDGSTTQGFMTLAAWAGIYEAGGTAVPKTPGHIVVGTTGAWQWWVSDGGGARAEHLKLVKSGKFSPPASDGVAVWEAAVNLNPDTGIGRLYLPGNDTTTGNRYVTLTDTEIATALAAAGLPATTIAETVRGCNVVMVEHYANHGTVNTARFPRFLSMWGQGRMLARDPDRTIPHRVVR